MAYQGHGRAGLPYRQHARQVYPPPPVVVVSQQMPWDGLSAGPNGRWWHRGGLARWRAYSMKNATHTNAHERTRFTQVRGPSVEVTPLLLPVSLSVPDYL